MAAPRIIFVPGGPGFSSRHEAAVLGPRFKARGWSAHFSDEPWRVDRSTPVSWDTHVDALAASIDGLSDVTLVAHSFAVHPVVSAINRLNPRQCRLVLVAPTLDIPVGHQAVVRLAAKGLSESDAELTRRMLETAAKSQSLFDAPMQQALGLAATDPTLFARYWCDPIAFQEFAHTLAEPQNAFDLGSFVAVLSQLAELKWVLPTAPGCEILAAVGSGDPVVDAEHTREALADWAPQATLEVFAGRGHWLHLEAPDQFCDFLARHI